MVKVLRTTREIFDFVDSLTPREADQLVRLMDSKPEIMDALFTDGLVIKLVKKPKKGKRKSQPLRAFVKEGGKVEIRAARL